MEYIKNKEDITTELIQSLYFWLKNEIISKEYFNGDNKANAWNDFEFFNQTTDRTHLVMPNEVLLVDTYVDAETWLVIGQIGKSKEKQKLKILHKVIKISEMPHFKCGYWLIPKFYYHT